MEQFPLNADAEYGYARRFDPAPGGHHGTDIFAKEGTPVVAVSSGSAFRETDPKGGLVVYLNDAINHERFYYAHLHDQTAGLPTREEQAKGSIYMVAAGDVLGHVGKSGNAKNGPPHLHFQMKRNGKLVDPYPYLRASDPHRAPRMPPSQTPGGRTPPSIPPGADWSWGPGIVWQGLGAIGGLEVLIALGLAYWYLEGKGRG